MAAIPDTADIDALLGHIQSATHAAVAEYRKTGHGVPSPDNVSPHPLDSAPDALTLKKAIRVLEGACERLCTTLAQPMHTITNRSMPYEAPCMRLAVEKQIPDVLEGFPEGLHVESIAARTSLDSGKLRQVLRLLATRGCFKEVAEDVFANNRLSLTLLSTNPVSAIVLATTGECMKAVNSIPEAFVNSEYAFSASVNKSAFAYSVRGEMEDAVLFDWYKAHPELGQRFDKAMIGWTRTTGSISVMNSKFDLLESFTPMKNASSSDFPWGKMPPGTTICDIGSGVGTVSLSIAKAHSYLHVTLQDLPEPLQQARIVWSHELPEAVDNKRVEFVTMDFLKETPVGAQNIYYMKHILHNWPDSDAITILRNVANAMTRESRLLIHEIVLRHVHSSSHFTESDGTALGVECAPTPLLPNYGTGNIRNYNQDVNMLAMFNCRERTCEEYAMLGAQVGLELVKVWDLTETDMLEFCLVSS
ncbi:hypothetical protein V5O48_016138 [Marasmius crinis-equi]|uniref:O-methyltransferase n=1 Tax=Marasmius crinis-equi TaxID=585013 RepID=A0ABR3ESL1_9AGAR